MKFSQRSNWNTEESALARAHRERLAAGLPVADLTASNPTRCGFDYGAGLLDVLNDDRALDYDPQPLGLHAAREAVCEYYSDHGVHVEPGQVTLTTSTSEAYSYIFRLLCDPGSEILVPQPGRLIRRGFGGRSGIQANRRRGRSCWCIRTIRRGILQSRGRQRRWRSSAGNMN